MAEAAIVGGIVRLLRARGAWYVKIHGTGTGRAGTPDLLACYRGQMLTLEVKTVRGRVSRLQRHELDRARGAGAIAEVVRSVAEVELLLDRVDRDGDPDVLFVDLSIDRAKIAEAIDGGP